MDIDPPAFPPTQGNKVNQAFRQKNEPIRGLIRYGGNVFNIIVLKKISGLK